MYEIISYFFKKMDMVNIITMMVVFTKVVGKMIYKKGKDLNYWLIIPNIQDNLRLENVQVKDYSNLQMDPTTRGNLKIVNLMELGK